MEIELVNAACVTAFVLLVIWKIMRGYDRGLVKELHNLVSVASFVCAVVIFVLLYISYKQKEYGNVLFLVVALCAVGAVCKLIHILLFPFKGISGIAGISFINKITGMLVGAVEAAAIAYGVIWLMRYLEMYGFMI